MSLAFFLMISGFMTLNGSPILPSSASVGILSSASPRAPALDLRAGGWGLTLRAGVRALRAAAGGLDVLRVGVFVRFLGEGES